MLAPQIFYQTQKRTNATTTGYRAYVTEIHSLHDMRIGY